MTARHTYTLHCDAPDCAAFFTCDADRAQHTRAAARAQGWTAASAPRAHGPWKSLDFCADHARLADAPPAAASISRIEGEVT